MSVCEKCDALHSGEYGSGRFCCAVCARGYVTQASRAQINLKISAALKGRVGWAKGRKQSSEVIAKRLAGFTVDSRARFAAAISAQAKAARSLKYEQLETDVPVSFRLLRQYLLETVGKCETCGLSTWRDAPLTLEVHHLDGCKRNNWRSNAALLCPNCHSQTPSFRKKLTLRV